MRRPHGLTLLLAILAPPAAGAGPPASLADRPRLEAFLDGVMAAQQAAHGIVGVSVAVVAGGEVVLAKGYGHADLAAGRRVDAARTLFRVGSVTKPFVWTALMQLAEQGRLDLDADVNVYLGDVRVPPTFPEPVTLRHLMTHTAGFEDRVIGLFARTPDRLRPLARLLREEMPARVRPPARLASYSNHGTALAAYVLERVSGLPWESYVEKNILEPLGIEHATVRQPVPEALAPDLAVGYRWSLGEATPEPFEFVPAGPAGSMSAAAADIARFMLAHLQDGRYGATRILPERGARRMRERAFGHDSGLNGVCLGFYEMSRNGRRIYGHDGATLWFHSRLALLPGEGVGFFVSTNTDTGERARDQVFSAFLDRYFPAPSAPPPPARADLGRLAGRYAPLRVSETTLARLAGLIDTIQVAAEDGGLVTSGLGPEPRRWVPVNALVFREADGHDALAFRQDDRGRITHLFVDSFPPIAFARLPASGTPAFHFAWAGTCLVLLLSAVSFWPLRAVRTRLGVAPPSRAARLARALGWTASLLLVSFMVGLVAVLTDPVEIAFGVPPALRALLVLPLVASALAVPVAGLALLAWRRRWWSLAARLHYTAVAAALVALLAWLDRWNLLGFRY